MKAQRNMYYDPEKLDLEVLRRDAIRNSKDTRFTDEAPVVVIHHHRVGDKCDHRTHEYYENGAKQ